jgi:hypothetical protein
MEEKLLNELFVLLEYTSSFKELVEDMAPDIREALFKELLDWHADQGQLKNQYAGQR